MQINCIFGNHLHLIWIVDQMSLILKCKMLLMMNKIFLGSFYKQPEAITNPNGRDNTVAPWTYDWPGNPDLGFWLVENLLSCFDNFKIDNVSPNREISCSPETRPWKSYLEKIFSEIFNLLWTLDNEVTGGFSEIKLFSRQHPSYRWAVLTLPWVPESEPDNLTSSLLSRRGGNTESQNTRTHKNLKYSKFSLARYYYYWLK